jgi:hypothetical protein
MRSKMILFLAIERRSKAPGPQDAVGELLVGCIPHLGMNSKAHSENPLKRVQEFFLFLLFNPLWV